MDLQKQSLLKTVGAQQNKKKTNSGNIYICDEIVSE